MSKVVVLKCENYEIENVYQTVKKGIDLLGGIEKFVSANNSVLLKPNMLTEEVSYKAVTTHPSVFSAVAKLVKTVSKDVSYGDSPGFGRASNVSKRCGIDEVAKEEDIKLVDFEDSIAIKYDKGKNTKSQDVMSAKSDMEVNDFVKSFIIAKPIEKADIIISLPKLKTHALTTMTGAVKNQFGCVPGLRKANYHLELPDTNDFSKMLLDLNACINPKLYVMDGVVAMEGNGPRNGTTRELKVLLFSTDAIAIDRVAAEIMGIKYSDIPTIKYGGELGYGVSELNSIEILGDNIEELKVNNIQMPHKKSSLMRFFMKLVNKYPVLRKLSSVIVPKPVINSSKCVKCGVCVKVCPITPNAIDFTKGRKNPPQYNYNNCIKCYCCQELCPHNAITLKVKF